MAIAELLYADHDRGDRPRSVFRYRLWVAAPTDYPYATAETDLYAGTPTTYDSLPRKRLRLMAKSPSEWRAEVTYEPWNSSPPAGNVGDSYYEFSTQGGTAHITQALSTIDAQVPPGGGAVPDFDGAIAVTDNEVQGVDIVTPKYTFSETYWIADASITAGYKALLFAGTGRVNNATWRGFAAGEVLFLGARGSKRGSGDWQLSFDFVASQNATNLAVGGITIPAKKGWEHLWVLYENTEDASAKRLVKRPAAAYIEQVYGYFDFTSLGIGP